MDERDAIARLKRGDIGGLETLVRRYQLPALKAAVLICRDYPLAEDLVQAAFLRAYERIDQFDAARPFGPWFLRGVVRDARKAASRRPQVRLDAAALAAVEARPAQEGDLAARLAAAESAEALWAALGRLTPAQRAAVVAHDYLGLSDAELARRWALPAGTVRRRLHDARRRLRQLLPTWVRPSPGD